MFAPVLLEVPGQMTRCPCGFGAYDVDHTFLLMSAKNTTKTQWHNKVQQKWHQPLICETI